MDELNDLDPELVQKLIELGVLDPKLQDISEQRFLAHGRRYGQGPEGRGAGGIYVAANPLEHIANAWQGIKAEKEMGALDKQREQVYGQQTETRKKFAEWLQRLKTARGIPNGAPMSDTYSSGPVPGGSY